MWSGERETHVIFLRLPLLKHLCFFHSLQKCLYTQSKTVTAAKKTHTHIALPFLHLLPPSLSLSLPSSWWPSVAPSSSLPASSPLSPQSPSLSTSAQWPLARVSTQINKHERKFGGTVFYSWWAKIIIPCPRQISPASADHQKDCLHLCSPMDKYRCKSCKT